MNESKSPFPRVDVFLWLNNNRGREQIQNKRRKRIMNDEDWLKNEIQKRCGLCDVHACSLVFSVMSIMFGWTIPQRIITNLLAFLMFTLPSISYATKRLAVLEFQGIGVDEEIVSLLADDVRIGVLEGIGNRLVDNEEILVMTRENMMEFMKEMDKDPLECFGECEVEVARNIGADYLISGKIIKVEQIYVLHLKLHESSRGELLAGEQAREDDLTKMLDTAITSGRTLIQKGISLSDAPTPTIVSQPSTPIQSAGLKSNENDIIVNFETEPACAEVYVDGQFLCSQTPCQNIWHRKHTTFALICHDTKRKSSQTSICPNTNAPQKFVKISNLCLVMPTSRVPQMA